MSEDATPTPSLRLKPRAKPETQAAPSPSPTPSAPAGTAGADMGTLRLRPRLSTTATSEEHSPGPSENAEGAKSSILPPVPSPSASTKPDAPPSLAPGAVEQTDLSKLKLKPRSIDASASGEMPGSLLPPPVTQSPVRTAHPLPEIPSPIEAGKRRPPALPPLDGPLPPAVPRPAPVRPPVKPPAPVKPSAEGRPEQSRVFKTSLMVLAGIVFLGGAGATILAVRSVKKGNETAATPTAATPAKKEPASVAAEPAPSTPDEAATKSPGNPLVRQAESLPGKLIEQAQNAINAREQNSQSAAIEEAMNGPAAPTTQPAARPSGPTAKPATTASTPAKARPATSDSEEATSEPEPVSRPPASPNFRAFVVNMRVNGVFQGEPGRAFINGKLYYVGQVVDPQLGIRFQRLDARTKTLYFEDKTTAQVPRRY